MIICSISNKDSFRAKKLRAPPSSAEVSECAEVRTSGAASHTRIGRIGKAAAGQGPRDSCLILQATIYTTSAGNGVIGNSKRQIQSRFKHNRGMRSTSFNYCICLVPGKACAWGDHRILYSHLDSPLISNFPASRRVSNVLHLQSYKLTVPVEMNQSYFVNKGNST